MPPPETVQNIIAGLSDFILRYAVALAAVSVLSMGLLEAVKALLSTRDRFHKRLVDRWVETSALPIEVLGRIRGQAPGPTDPRRQAYVDLIQLTTGESVADREASGSIQWLPWALVPAHALFALELPRMLGQIQEAADQALASPQLLPELYIFLTAGAAPEDVENWYRWARTPPPRATDDAALAKDQADTYNRLRQHVRRRLDALQLTAGYRWQTGNQLASVTLGAILLFGALLMSRRGTDANVWLLLAAALLGGLMAPVAKDLVVALKRVRGGG